jgi:hypothetical protein
MVTSSIAFKAVVVNLNREPRQCRVRRPWGLRPRSPQIPIWLGLCEQFWALLLPSKMPPGRPRKKITPCRHCGKRFKRQEHLQRHERTRTTATHSKVERADIEQIRAKGRLYAIVVKVSADSEPPTASIFTSCVTCGRDLLTRHHKISHLLTTNGISASIDFVQGSSTSPPDSSPTSDTGFTWDPDVFFQDVLPTAFLDDVFPSFEDPVSVRPAPSNTFPLFSSRLPKLTEIENDADTGEGSEGIPDEPGVPWSVSVAIYEAFCSEVLTYSAARHVDISLPSKNTLTRNIEGYFRCLNENMPFIHPATFCVERKNVELVLAIAMLGALYRFEYVAASQLYAAAKAILLHRLRCDSLQVSSNLLSGDEASMANGKANTQRLQTFVLLITFASWTDKMLLTDALSMSKQLVMAIRENGVLASDEVPPDSDWSSWIAYEERRRTLYAAYVLFNMHSIAFEVAPWISNHEIHAFLPSGAEQWKANSTRHWRRLHRPVERNFQDALQDLLNGKSNAEGANFSSFGNYVLIHGLLQQIVIARDGCSGVLDQDTIESFESALRNWQLSWECTHDSSLDPLSSKGPIGLNATALLRIAYIRLNSNATPFRGLCSHHLAYTNSKKFSLKRSPSTDRAVLHAAHALSLLVRLGLELLSRVKLPFQSVEHSLCSLECAILLKDWLEMMASAVDSVGLDGLRDSEKRLLRILCGIIQETSLAETPSVVEPYESRLRRMAAIVMKLWAKASQGAHVVEISNVIADDIQRLADGLNG